MQVTVTGFALVRELLGGTERTIALDDDARAADAWNVMVAQCPQLAPLRESVRMARNDHLISHNDALHDGDEIALLPPFGGG